MIYLNNISFNKIMTNLEDLDTKEKVIEKFFNWLFDDTLIIDKSVELQKELDISLVQSYTDPYIYYPKQIANFFNTQAMQRLSRISQLALANDIYPNIYHNRLEHSKGVYNRKLEEFLYNFNNENWRNMIEKNNKKTYLLAELIKMSGHDIGHLPLSHLMEIELLSYKGAHEDLGKRIMLENQEIQQVLSKISPELPKVLSELYERNIMNFKEHDESNYDVDRLDYVSRDNFYFGTPIHFPHTNYESVQVQLGADGKIQDSNTHSILPSTSSGFYIDVYSSNCLNTIETLLEKRLYGYEKIYTSPLVIAREGTIHAFFDAFANTKDYNNYRLGSTIEYVKNNSITSIDLNSLLGLDDISFYSEIIDIAENHPDPNIKSLAVMTIPCIEAFFNLIYSHLQIKSKGIEQLSADDISFLKKIKKIIKSDTASASAIKNKYFKDENTLFFDNNIFDKLQSFPESTKKILKNCISINHIHKKAYNMNEPIYIYDSTAKNIYELANHPNRKYNWYEKAMDFYSCFTYIPLLKFYGISDEIIRKLDSMSIDASNYSLIVDDYSPIYNMQPLKTGNNYKQYLSQLDLDEQR